MEGEVLPGHYKILVKTICFPEVPGESFSCVSATREVLETKLEKYHKTLEDLYLIMAYGVYGCEGSQRKWFVPQTNSSFTVVPWGR